MRRFSIGLLLLGIVLFIGAGMYYLIRGLLMEVGIPIVFRVSLVLIMVGLVLTLVYLIWERWKGGHDEDVDRKY